MLTSSPSIIVVCLLQRSFADKLELLLQFCLHVGTLFALKFQLLRARYSLGLRPNGVLGSFLDGLMVKGSNFQLFQPRNLALSIGDPLALRGSIFWILGIIGKASQNTMIFWHRTKTSKSQRMSRSWEAHVASKNMYSPIFFFCFFIFVQNRSWGPFVEVLVPIFIGKLEFDAIFYF